MQQFTAVFRSLALVAGLSWLTFAAAAAEPQQPIDFNRDIRPILSNACLTCHGPDPAERQAGLRLDTPDGAVAETDSGEQAIVPGKPEESELVRRVLSDDEYEQMPPPESGKRVTRREVQLLTEWIRQGAPFATHWSYAKPVRPPVPDVAALSVEGQSDSTSGAAAWGTWPKNEIDRFILARMLRAGLAPSPAADRYTLIRRVSLDLTGLPPSIEDVEAFVHDPDPMAYEHLVDRLLAKPAYGEHWARMWLDLARYADSAGYADDPPRTIWAYRDWVIRSLNANKPFDQFTIEQIAGDLLPNPTADQRTATAFHRNTLTNNEGGTNDEEFRNVAIVDRVNTTMAVWMGTTMACAQCHSHKYDPISQEEYFRFFAVFNSTADADRRNESPLLSVYTAEQELQQEAWQAEVAELERALSTPTPERSQAQRQWEQTLASDLAWQPLRPVAMKSREGAPMTLLSDASVLVAEPRQTDVYSVELPVDGEPSQVGGEGASENGSVEWTALRLETLPDDSLPGKGSGFGGGNFVITRVSASLVPPQTERPRGRFVRIEIPGSEKILSLAEVQVFRGSDNIAPRGVATQSSTAFEGPPQRALDGNTNGDYEANSTTHTATETDPWWELDLKAAEPIDRIVIWSRTDHDLHTRLSNFRVALFDEDRQAVWETTVADPPDPSREFSVGGARPVALVAAYADYAQDGFDPSGVILSGGKGKAPGWAVGGELNRPHDLTLIPAKPFSAPEGSKLAVTIEQLSPHENHTLGRFRVAISADPNAVAMARTPANLVTLAKLAPDQRTAAEQAELTQFFLSEITPDLATERQRLQALQKQLSDMKPATTVPIMQELPDNSRRKTQVQRRGNFLDTGAEVSPGVPAAFHPLPAKGARPGETGPAHAADGTDCDRLAVAYWLVDENNPLTARVTANRYWEAVFGRGIVTTSEEFGSQGDLPTHPQLLDWLATELVRLKWDTKALLRMLVTSAAYRQTSRVTPERLDRDPDNVWLSRGPRFRLSAEMVRDQALAVGGLLSPKMYGPPVKPPQPSSGLKAAFGGGVDWQTSQGEDRYRRGLYTTWRRSSPYPSMATFDAPNREVCTIRRGRTNTPLQALVTLNDPVYIEAAQALARRMAKGGATPEQRATFGLRVCLSRPPSDEELRLLVQLHDEARQRFAAVPDEARRMATEPLGGAPEGADVVDLAAWTVVANVLLNLDEMLMRR